jgi:hypothetical protein
MGCRPNGLTFQPNKLQTWGPQYSYPGNHDFGNNQNAIGVSIHRLADDQDSSVWQLL